MNTVANVDRDVDREAQHLAKIGEVTNRTREVLAQLRVLLENNSYASNEHTRAATKLHADLVELWDDLGELTRAVQQREVLRWKSDPPPRIANRSERRANVPRAR